MATNKQQQAGGCNDRSSKIIPTTTMKQEKGLIKSPRLARKFFRQNVFFIPRFFSWPFPSSLLLPPPPRSFFPAACALSTPTPPQLKLEKKSEKNNSNNSNMQQAHPPSTSHAKTHASSHLSLPTTMHLLHNSSHLPLSPPCPTHPPRLLPLPRLPAVR